MIRIAIAALFFPALASAIVSNACQQGSGSVSIQAERQIQIIGWRN